MNPIKIERMTRETQINLTFQLFGSGVCELKTGIGFFDHLLELFAFHGLFDLRGTCTGDTQVDDHHLIEDLGIVIGQAIYQSFPPARNFRRYACCFLPMDETLARAVVDLSGRPFLVFQSEFHRAQIGNFSTEMVAEFFRALAVHAKMTLHLQIEYGENDHHKIEALFKAAARALHEAVLPDPNRTTAASSKGVL